MARATRGQRQSSHLGFEQRSGRASLVYLLSAMHRIGKALERGVEGCILLGETKPHDRRHRVFFIERRHRYRRHLVVGHDALAEGFVGLVKTERREVDGKEIGALRPKNRETDTLQSPGETIPASRQFRPHLMKIFGRLAEAIGDRDLKIVRGREGEKLMYLRGDAQ